MSNAITTTGTTKDPVTTKPKVDEPTSAWVTRHNNSVQSATPSGNRLTTRWVSANGDEEVVTNRTSGESDVDFLQRHVLDYVTEMVDAPPIA